jgi:hypothetical protein
MCARSSSAASLSCISKRCAVSPLRPPTEIHLTARRSPAARSSESTSSTPSPRIGEGDAHHLADDALAGEAQALITLLHLGADRELHFGTAQQLGGLAARIAGAARRGHAVEIDDIFEHEAAMPFLERRNELRRRRLRRIARGRYAALLRCPRA